MDLEKNALDIINEEGHFGIDEENNLNQGHESFREGEERFSVDEVNIKNPEENDLSSKSKKSGEASKTVHSLGGALSIPAIAVTLVGSIAIIGTTSGIIPALSSNHIFNFLSRSTELGFEVNKNSDKTLMLYLHNEEYGVSEEITLRDSFVFSDLMPSTVYDLEVYEIKDNQSKKVYAANYLTKAKDNYGAFVRYSNIEEDLLMLDVMYEGNNIEFVTVKVLGDNGKTILNYEGSPKNEFTVNVNGYTNVTCRVSINGEMTHFEQLINPDNSVSPVGDWLSDDNNHWHEVDGQIQDLEAHDFVESIVNEPTFEETGTAKDVCSICGYETAEHEIPVKEHNYYEEWAKDETHHWHECYDDGYADLKSEYEEHIFEEVDCREPTYSSIGFVFYECSVCGATKEEQLDMLVHNYATDWSYNSYTHWHACTDEGYESEKGDEESHDFDTSGACSCGYNTFTYELDDTLGGYKITGKDSDSNFNFSTIVFPNEYEGNPVVDIASKLFPYGGVINATIPNSFIHISESTFYACSTMQSLTLPFVGSSASNTSVSPESFFGYIFGTQGYGGSDPCYWVDMSSYGGARCLIPQTLTTINITGGYILDHALRGLYYTENISISGVSTIGDYAFADYNTANHIQSITIDNAVEHIGNYAFANNPLQTLTFLGTKAEWEDIDLGENWRTDSSLTMVQCSDEVITLE